MIQGQLGSAEREEALAIGCTGSMSSRQLQGSTCDSGSLYCWNRCMSLAEFGLDSQSCSSRNLQTQCINTFNQMWNGIDHADYFPGCYNATAGATPYPDLSGYTQPDRLHFGRVREFNGLRPRRQCGPGLDHDHVVGRQQRHSQGQARVQRFVRLVSDGFVGSFWLSWVAITR